MVHTNHSENLPALLTAVHESGYSDMAKITKVIQALNHQAQIRRGDPDSYKRFIKSIGAGAGSDFSKGSPGYILWRTVQVHMNDLTGD